MEAETDVSEPPVKNEGSSNEVEAATDESEPTTVTTQSDMSEPTNNSDIADIEPTYSLEDMDEIRKWWEIPCVAHFCSLFRAAFDLPDFDIEELEEALLASGTPEGSMLMCDLISQLLNGCYSRTDIKSYNFELYLKDIYKKKAEAEPGFVNPLDETSFQMLTVRIKLELLQGICDFRLDADDVQDLLKGLDGDNLRVEPMGRDQHGNTYWYFYGVRLYREDPELKPEDNKKKDKQKPKKKSVKVEEKVKKKQEKSKGDKKKKRGRPRSVTPGRNGRRGRPRKRELIVNEPDEAKDDSVEVKEESKDESMIVDDDNQTEQKASIDETPSRRSSRRKTPKTPDVDNSDVVKDGDETPATPSDVTQSRRTRRLSRKAQEVAATASSKTAKEESTYDDTTEEESETEDEEEPAINGEADSDDDVPLASLKKEPVPPQRWHLICQTLEDWQGLAESFKESKVRCEKIMYRTITEDFLPEIPRIMEEKERDMKRRALENAPRRTSCRLEEKQKQREEEEKLLALQQAEEDRQRQEEEEERRRILELEKLEIQKRQREEREKQRERMREERERAVERRAKRAALREEKVRLLAERERLLAEGIELPPELQNLDSTTQRDDEDESEKLDSVQEELYSGMRKILYTIKAHDDSWPFWEPVKEEFAPDYFNFIKKPMDLTTIEKKLDNKEYSTVEDFSDDFQLLFDNCEKYNGETSDFTYMARTLEKLFRARVRRLYPKRVSRYDNDEDYVMEESLVMPSKPRPKRQTASYAMENIHAVMMEQDEGVDDDSGTTPKSKYTIIYPALKARGDDMRTAEGQARFLQALQAAKRKEAAEEFNTKGNRSLMVQTNTLSMPPKPMRPVSVEDPVKGIIVQNSRNKMQLLAKTVSVTSRYNGQPTQKSVTSDEDPELASLPMHRRIKEREAQKALNKLGEPKAEPVNDYISVVRKSDVSRLYSGLIQKAPKQNSPQKCIVEKATATNIANITPKVVHISLDDFKRLQSQKAKVICVPSRDAGKSGTVIHLSTGGIRTAMSTARADSFVAVNKEEQKATPAQGVVPSKDVKVLEHSSDKVTVLKTTPATTASDDRSQDQSEKPPGPTEDIAEQSKETPNKDSESAEVEGVEAPTLIPETTEETAAEKSEESPKQVPKLYIKVPKPVESPTTQVQTPKTSKTKKKPVLITTEINEETDKSVETPKKEVPKTCKRSQKTPDVTIKNKAVSPQTPVLTPKTIMKKKTVLLTPEKKDDEATPKTIMKKKSVLLTPEKKDVGETPKTIMKKKTVLLTPQTKDVGATQTEENDSPECPVPRKKLRKSVSWSKNLTTESPYIPPVKDVQTSTPPRASCLYKDGIHSRMPPMHAAPLQTSVVKEREIGSEKTIVNGMIVTKSIFQPQPVIKTYSKKEPQRKRSYESDFFLDEDDTAKEESREPSPPKLTRIEHSENICDHSEEAPPDIISDHENDSSQTSDSESMVQISAGALLQKNITKLHTSLIKYSGQRKKKDIAASKQKPASTDDDSTCAKVVRRTKRSPQTLRQTRHTRVTAPLHDDVVPISRDLRKPGRPSNFISIDYQATVSRKQGRGRMKKTEEATKVDSETQVEEPETEVQEPVLDLVSEVNMEDLEEGSTGEAEAEAEMLEKTAGIDEHISAAEPEKSPKGDKESDTVEGVHESSAGTEDGASDDVYQDSLGMERLPEDEEDVEATDKEADSEGLHQLEQNQEEELPETTDTAVGTDMEYEETEDQGVSAEQISEETQTAEPYAANEGINMEQAVNESESVENKEVNTEEIPDETEYDEEHVEEEVSTEQNGEEMEYVEESKEANTEQNGEEMENVEQPVENEGNTDEIDKQTEYVEEMSNEQITEETESVKQLEETSTDEIPHDDVNIEKKTEETEYVEQPRENTTEQIAEEAEYVEQAEDTTERIVEETEYVEQPEDTTEQIVEETEYVEQPEDTTEQIVEETDNVEQPEENTEQIAQETEYVEQAEDTTERIVEETKYVELPEEDTEQIVEETEYVEQPEDTTEQIVEETEYVEQPEENTEQIVEETDNVEQPEENTEQIVEETEYVEQPEDTTEQIVEETEYVEQPEENTEQIVEETDNVEQPEENTEQIVEETDNVEQPEEDTEQIVEETEYVEQAEDITEQIVEETEYVEQPDDNTEQILEETEYVEVKGLDTKEVAEEAGQTSEVDTSEQNAGEMEKCTGEVSGDEGSNIEENTVPREQSANKKTNNSEGHSEVPKTTEHTAGEKAEMESIVKLVHEETQNLVHCTDAKEENLEYAENSVANDDNVVEEEVVLEQPAEEEVSKEESVVQDSSSVPDDECAPETEAISEQDQVDASADCGIQDISDAEEETDGNMDVAGEEEVVGEHPTQNESGNQSELHSVSQEVRAEDVSEEMSAEKDSSLMETESEEIQNTVCDNASEHATTVSENVEGGEGDIEMADNSVSEQVVGTDVDYAAEANQNTGIIVSGESLHSEETGGVGVEAGDVEVDGAYPDVLSGTDTDVVAQIEEVSEEVIPMETECVEQVVSRNQEISVQVIDYDENDKGEQTIESDNVCLEAQTDSSRSEAAHCSENTEIVRQEPERDISPESDSGDPPVLQRISPVEHETIPDPSASEWVESEVSAIQSVSELDQSNSDASAIPSIEESEQSKSVNGTETVGDKQTATDSQLSDSSGDFKSPSGDPVKKSSRSPVFSAPSDIPVLQKNSPPRPFHGKSQLGKGSPENSPQKVSPNSSPSKSGSVDRNVFSEFASNVNSESKTSSTSSPGKSSSMLNLPRGFAASLNKLKFKLPSKSKGEDRIGNGSVTDPFPSELHPTSYTSEDQSSDGSS